MERIGNGSTTQRHLSGSEIRAYRDRQVAPEHVIRVFDHLAACEACRDRAVSSAQVAHSAVNWRTAIESDASPHLTGDQIDAIAEGGRTSASWKYHLSKCTACSDELTGVRHVKAEMESAGVYRGPSWSKLRNRWWERFWLHPVPALGLAALTLALFVTAVTRYLPFSGTPSVVTTPSVTLRDGAFRIVATSSGELRGLETMAPNLRSAAWQALVKNNLSIPLSISGLIGRSRGLRSGNARENGATLTAPVGTAVDSGTPTFRWKAMPSTASYVVEVYTDRFQPVVKSPRLKSEEWTSTAELPAGVFLWQVVITQANGSTIRIPSEGEPEARFRVLDSAALLELARLRSKANGSHLALGVVYLQKGLLNDAEREWKQLAVDNPGVSYPDLMLKRLRSLRGE